MWTCVSMVVSGTNGVQWMGLFFLLFLCSASQNDRSFFPFLILFVLFLFFNFFLVIVYNNTFFQTSQLKVTRPLATLGWRPERVHFLPSLRLPFCTVKAFGSITAEVLAWPRARGLSDSRRSSRWTFKGKYMTPLPCSPDLLPKQSSLGACPSTLGNLSAQDISVFVFWGVFLFVFFISNCGRRGLNTSNDKRSVVKLNTPRVNKLVWHLFFMSRAPCASSILVLTLIVTLLVWLCSVKICNWLRITVGVHSYSTKSPQVFWAGVD